MERILPVTIQLKLDTALRGSSTSFIAQLPEMLRFRLGDLLADSPDNLNISCFGQTPKANNDFEAELADKRQIAFIWSVEDVHSVRPDLTDEQAWEVLLLAKHGHDANFGINCDVLSTLAESLYGDAPEQREDDA